ncbi:hypothetical protein [Lapillicoccus jejuensis]|uniref:Uncharacterized protein n=1 Tax=Lapillicoccus jejuensis TaxID=402171 RepID=A0A542DZX2_9MICO|nr:hypothetical protein [Lapillicoccus jejuensis]TQJ08635.1 hypothetical protein FB458_1726 [Lapillicoccus jejuensis]
MTHHDSPSAQAQLDLLDQQRTRILDRSGLPLRVVVTVGVLLAAYVAVWAFRPDADGLALVPVALVIGLAEVRRRRGVGSARRDPLVWVRIPLLLVLVVGLAIVARALASLDAPWPYVVLAAAAAGGAFVGGSVLDQRARRRWAQDER